MAGTRRTRSSAGSRGSSRSSSSRRLGRKAKKQESEGLVGSLTSYGTACHEYLFGPRDRGFKGRLSRAGRWVQDKAGHSGPSRFEMCTSALGTAASLTGSSIASAYSWCFPPTNATDPARVRTPRNASQPVYAGHEDDAMGFPSYHESQLQNRANPGYHRGRAAYGPDPSFGDFSTPSNRDGLPTYEQSQERASIASRAHGLLPSQGRSDGLQSFDHPPRDLPASSTLRRSAHHTSESSHAKQARRPAIQAKGTSGWPSETTAPPGAEDSWHHQNPARPHRLAY